MSAEAPPTDPKRERLHSLSMELHRSPGRQLEIELQALALSARTFEVNTVGLLRAVETFENAFPNPLLQRGKRDELWEYCFEVVRLFQNAIASGESFLAHCRSTVRRRYRKESFLTEFTEHEKAQIKDSSVCMFVKELRGFLLHKESIKPMVSRRLIDFSDPMESMCSIVLNTEGIETERNRWKKENPKALEYLDNLHGSLNIRRLIYEYRDTVKRFGDWLLNCEKEINAQILVAIEPVHAEIDGLLKEIETEEVKAMKEDAKVYPSWLGSKAD